MHIEFHSTKHLERLKIMYYKNFPSSCIYILIICLDKSMAVIRRNCTLQDVLSFMEKITGATEELTLAPHFMTIGMDIMIMDIFNFDEKESSMQMVMRLNLTWTDPRLDKNCTRVAGEESLSLDTSRITNIWKPKFAVLGVRESKNVLSPNEVNQIGFQEEGQIEWVLEMVLTIGCEMDFTLFPFDHVTCRMVIHPLLSSFKFEWGDISKGRWFTFQSHQIVSITPGYDHEEEEPICEVQLKRFLMYYILQGYFPNALVVFVAWVSFFIDPNSAPARVSVGVTSLVASVLQYGNILNSIPKVGYVKIIDVWMTGCSLFIIYSLVEFAYISSIRSTNKNSIKIEKKCLRIDKVSRVGYPIVFFLFALVYFLISVELI